MLDELEQELAQIYTTTDAARLVMDSAGIPSTFVEFKGPVIEIWHRIVEQADKRNKLPDLLRVAIRDYPQRERLQRIYGAFLYGLRSDKDVEGMVSSLPQRGSSRSEGDPFARLERDVNRLSEIVNGTDWGAEGLLAKVEKLQKNQTFNRWLLIVLAFVNFILAVTIAIALSGVWRGAG